MNLVEAERNEDPSEGAPSQRRLHWNRELFLTGDRSPQPCPAVLDITGRARFLFFGPYRPLSPGLWRVQVSLDLSPDAAACPLALQFGAEPDYSTVPLVAGRSGVRDVEIEHGFEDGDLAQVRLWLQKAAFHGEVRLLGVTARPADPTPLEGAA